MKGLQEMRLQLTAKEAALVASFTSVYAILTFVPMFQLIGFFGKTITASAILAPIMGIILGPYLGTASTLLGGIVGLSLNPYFSLPSLISGVAVALCAGLLYIGKRWLCAVVYLAFLLSFSFYVPIGPTWVYPLVTWFQIVGFLVLVSPLQSAAIRNMKSDRASRFLSSFFATALTSTLAGQIAGTLAFEIVSYPLFISDATAWRAVWETLTFLYPVERTAIAAFAAMIGSGLHKTLKSANLIPLLTR